MAAVEDDMPPERSVTPTVSAPNPAETTVHATPSKSVNANGKRTMTTSEPRPPPRHRQGDHLKDAQNVLYNWRLKTVRTCYTPGPFTLAAFMPDSVIKTLASLRTIVSLEIMQDTIRWAFIDRHGKEVLDVLQKLDTFLLEQRESVKRAKAAERSAATEARQLEKRVAKDRVREANRREREQERERVLREKQADKENNNRMKLAARMEAAAAKLAMKPPPKRVRRAPLAGVTVLNMASSSSSDPPSASDSVSSTFMVYEVSFTNSVHSLQYK